MIQNLLLIGLGGMLGAVARYLIYTLTNGMYHKHLFPYGTLIVNLAGSLIIGILLALSLKYTLLARHHGMHYLLITGFLGAFTTFSTFSQDNMILIMDKQYGAFMVNVLLNVFIGLALTMSGYLLTRKLLL